MGFERGQCCHGRDTRLNSSSPTSKELDQSPVGADGRNNQFRKKLAFLYNLKTWQMMRSITRADIPIGRQHVDASKSWPLEFYFTFPFETGGQRTGLKAHACRGLGVRLSSSIRYFGAFICCFFKFLLEMTSPVTYLNQTSNHQLVAVLQDSLSVSNRIKSPIKSKFQQRKDLNLGFRVYRIKTYENHFVSKTTS